MSRRGFFTASGIAVGALVGLPATEAAAAAPRGAARHVREVLPAAPADAVALTIDDGPHPVWTPQVLELLQRHGVRATFALIGANAVANPALVRRIAAEGHVLCNHSMNHPSQFGRLAAAAVRQQIDAAQRVITAAGGVAPTLFRAPGGDFSPQVLAAAAERGLVPLGWDVDPRDWTLPGTAAVTARMLAAGPGDIVLCHDGGGNRAQTVAALATVLPALKARGLEFVALA